MPCNYLGTYNGESRAAKREEDLGKSYTTKEERK
jgi:hypothetical protein